MIWRGQSSTEWALETSFDRAIRKSGGEPTQVLAEIHLQRFKRAARGRRIMPTRSELTDDEWWALGQHYGLATPLLDWTYAPFVALYFAFLDPVSSDAAGERAVWAFSAGVLNQVAAANTLPSVSGTFRILDPLVDENTRLVNQNGVFTRGPVGVTMDDWLQTAYDDAALLKIIIPSDDREDCLRHLNQMNINHVTLFPDLDGSSRHCNHQLTISQY
jgi:hypothetical protein